MGFQKSVSQVPVIGIPGQEVNPGQAVYTAFNYVSDGTAAAGAFAFAKALEAAADFGVNSASATGAAGAKVLGFVARNLAASLPTPLSAASGAYPVGCGLGIAIRGQFYAAAAGAATEGQSVLCDPTTGKITYGAAGTANDTGWVVHLPQGVKEVAEGDTVIYECFGLTITPATK